MVYETGRQFELEIHALPGSGRFRAKKNRRAERRGGLFLESFASGCFDYSSAHCLAPKLPTIFQEASWLSSVVSRPTLQLPAISRSEPSVPGPGP